ncbi:MAG: VWA domain-containing protein [Chloroflexi bacterium]|nr:VWA domain-containing protein [Chloroflexota bacterium]
MAYQADISRSNPGCFLFLLDQSGSMADPFSGTGGHSKADELATIINRLLASLVIRCSKDEGVRDYFEVGVIGYGGSSVKPVLPTPNGPLVKISQLANAPLRIEDRTQKIPDGAGGLVEQTVKFPIWIDPKADGGTPMAQALNEGTSAISTWVDQHRGAFPPVIFNITDGEATDGDPGNAADALKNLGTEDGAALLFNVHLSEHRAPAVEFPASDETLPDTFAKRLFGMSSPLPPHLQTAARQEGYAVEDGTRGFVFNADAAAVIQFLDIGTRPANLR